MSALTDQVGADVGVAQHGHQTFAVVIGSDEVLDDGCDLLTFLRLCGLLTAPASGGLGVAESLSRGVEEGQVRERPGPRVLALQREDLVTAQCRRAPTEI